MIRKLLGLGIIIFAITIAFAGCIVYVHYIHENTHAIIYGYYGCPNARINMWVDGLGSTTTCDTSTMDDDVILAMIGTQSMVEVEQMGYEGMWCVAYSITCMLSALYYLLH